MRYLFLLVIFCMPTWVAANLLDADTRYSCQTETTFGWEGGLMVGLAGPAGSTFRLGYGAAPTLGMSYTWWEGAGAGWGTDLSTAIDYELIDGDFDITVNLGLGF